MLKLSIVYIYGWCNKIVIDYLKMIDSLSWKSQWLKLFIALLSFKPFQFWLNLHNNLTNNNCCVGCCSRFLSNPKRHFWKFC